MSTITRRFLVNASKATMGGFDDVRLGRATEWDGEGILIELDVLPVGNWWGGVATLQSQNPEDDLPTTQSPMRQYELVAAKRPANIADGKTKWLKVGSAQEIGGKITIDLVSRPEGNWWDGKLRLFIQKTKRS